MLQWCNALQGLVARVNGSTASSRKFLDGRQFTMALDVYRCLNSFLSISNGESLQRANG